MRSDRYRTEEKDIPWHPAVLHLFLGLYCVVIIAPECVVFMGFL